MGETILSLPEVDPENDQGSFLSKKASGIWKVFKDAYVHFPFQTSCGAHKAIGYQGLFPHGGGGIKQPGYEADSKPLILRLGMRGSIPSLYDASLWHSALIKHRGFL
jgi:hypothetical protein